MSWRDLTPLDDWYELDRPDVQGRPDGEDAVNLRIELLFSDSLSQQWFAEWLRSKRGWQAFAAWVDEKR